MEPLANKISGLNLITRPLVVPLKISEGNLTYFQFQVVVYLASGVIPLKFELVCKRICKQPLNRKNCCHHLRCP